MKPAELLEILSVAKKLKCNTRHCYTSSGRHESVAEHSWRLALMAMLLAPEFPETDMDRVIRMCLIHDLGEAFTGDIPTFDKTDADTRKEDALYKQWVQTLPEKTRENVLLHCLVLSYEQAKTYEGLLTHLENVHSLTWDQEQYFTDCQDRAKTACSSFAYTTTGFTAEAVS